MVPSLHLCPNFCASNIITMHKPSIACSHQTQHLRGYLTIRNLNKSKPKWGVISKNKQPILQNIQLWDRLLRTRLVPRVFTLHSVRLHQHLVCTQPVANIRIDRGRVLLVACWMNRNSST